MKENKQDEISLSPEEEREGILRMNHAVNFIQTDVIELFNHGKLTGKSLKKSMEDYNNKNQSDIEPMHVFLGTIELGLPNCALGLVDPIRQLIEEELTKTTDGDLRFVLETELKGLALLKEEIKRKII